ncbi:MAG: adenosylcobinamide amidohydrolase [Crenarchaeota archaeon]|nr:adenosylcobinamide amidohydrolase [Thermoproteota archaeon]
MKQTNLGNGIRFVEEENIIALISDKPLTAISSAIHNGGFTKTKVIANTQVTDEYGDVNLHDDPESFIIKTYNKLGLNEEFVGMVTYAMVKDFKLFSKSDQEAKVTVIATAGCTHAESAGEKIEFAKIEGTINIMVLIEGNPTDSCLTSTIITATEAKTAALRDLDLRSRWSGDEATGTITDAMVVAKTGEGPTITYGGPASNLGQLIGCCTREAVKDAVINAKVGGYPANRSIINRLQERHLPITKLSTELSKAKSLGLDEKVIAARLTKLLDEDPTCATLILAAAKLDEDIKKGLIPPQFGDIKQASEKFAEKFNIRHDNNANQKKEKVDNIEGPLVNLSPFIKEMLLILLRNTDR